jgi:hypothetical protein
MEVPSVAVGGICQRWAIRMPGPYGGRSAAGNDNETELVIRLGWAATSLLIVQPEPFGLAPGPQQTIQHVPQKGYIFCNLPI